jgi:hypothetical protein
MNFFLVVGKGNNTNNFPFAYSKSKSKACNYADMLKENRQSIRVQRCTGITILCLLEKYYIVNLDQ